MTLTRQTLPNATAFAYLRDVLSQGRGLSQRLFAIDLEAGTLWTYLRSDVSLDYAQAHLNETWLIIPDGWSMAMTPEDEDQPRITIASQESLCVEFMQQFLDGSSRAYCVFEDANRDKGEPYLEKHRQEPYTFHSEDVFYVLTHETATPDTIIAGLRATNAWVQTVVLARMPADGGGIRPWTDITDAQMAALVNNVEAILVSAFDGVGYVVWEKD